MDSDTVDLIKREVIDYVQSSMKGFLVVNDRYGGPGRMVLREAALTEFNGVQRFVLNRLEGLCTTSGSLLA